MDTHENVTEKKSYEILAVIVNFGVGSKILQLGKKCGISGGTIFLGKGTQHCLINDFLEFLNFFFFVHRFIPPRIFLIILMQCDAFL